MIIVFTLIPGPMSVLLQNVVPATLFVRHDSTLTSSTYGSPSGSEQALIALRRYALQLGKPNVVLYLGAENDYGDDLLFEKGYRHQHLVNGSPYWGWTLQPLRWFAMTQIGTRIRLARGGRRRSNAGRRRRGLPMTG